MPGPPAGTVHVLDDDPSFMNSVMRLLSVAGIQAWPWTDPEAFLAV